MDRLEHIEALLLKHKKLEQLIKEEDKKLRPDEMLLHKLKLERLRLEEEIDGLNG